IDFASYYLAGVWQLKEAYFEMSESGTSQQTINPSQLDRIPSCPQCSNHYALINCPLCGGVYCLEEPGTQTCPWCGCLAIFRPARESDTLDDIVRSRG